VLPSGCSRLSLVFLPILASSDWKPQGDEHRSCASCCFCWPPSACPLPAVDDDAAVEAWYWRRFRSRVPYRLFALSNLASLLAPGRVSARLEPALDLKQLGWMWSFVFAVSSSSARSPRACR